MVQQTFCRAIERLDKYRGEAALYTWLFQICRNTLNDYFRFTSRMEIHRRRRSGWPTTHVELLTLTQFLLVQTGPRTIGKI